MSVPANKNETLSYYFYPLSQSCRSEITDQPSVRVKVTIPEKLLGNKFRIIKLLGNYLSTVSLINTSRETIWGSCVDYTKHSSTCEQDCKNHLTKNEIEVCQNLKDHFDPLKLTMIEYKVADLNISRGDVDQMRKVFEQIRKIVDAGECNSLIYSLLKTALGD